MIKFFIVMHTLRLFRLSLGLAYPLLIHHPVVTTSDWWSAEGVCAPDLAHKQKIMSKVTRAVLVKS